MRKKLLEEFKKRLLNEKKLIEDELKSFNWEIKPDVFEFNPPEMGEGDFEEREADEGEEIGKLVSLKKDLEERLREINSALEKIGKGNYGICENCGKKIELRVLLANPAARYCKKCLSSRLS